MPAESSYALSEGPTTAPATTVVYVRKQDAKAAKTSLQRKLLLDTRYRMTGADPTAFLHDEFCSYTDRKEGTASECIAIPIVENGLSRVLDDRHPAVGIDNDWQQHVVGIGRQSCPFSTSVLGNHGITISDGVLDSKQRRRRRTNDSTAQQQELAPPKCEERQLTIVQQVLLQTIFESSAHELPKNELKNAVATLPNKSCPKKLERIGDDSQRTIVIPRGAFLLFSDAIAPPHGRDGESFQHLVDKYLVHPQHQSSATTELSVVWSVQDTVQSAFLSCLWKNLARTHGNCARVVRKGDVDPESGVRESGYRILWPLEVSSNVSTEILSLGYVPKLTGPGSPGWITITEQGIRQSFDQTRVMFSRGNITEKVRFGKVLVQETDVVLDMYAGIGYYTLPALVHGKAKHVYACEWNEHALFALRYNLAQNGVSVRVGDVDTRITVLEGDCRVTTRRCAHKVDRVILGLLPSSEGGWPNAVQALRKDFGGWLHVHGNVLTSEREIWAFWLCRRIFQLARAEQEHWKVLCYHVERVKSFAPRVDHLVADIFVGPELPSLLQHVDMKGFSEGILLSTDKSFYPCPAVVEIPSCALGKNSVLHQEWMMTGL